MTTWRQLVGRRERRGGAYTHARLARSLVLCGILSAAVSFPALTNCSSSRGIPEAGKVEGWEGRLVRLVWVCYSPPNSDPPRGVEATPEAIRDDLAVLRRGRTPSIRRTETARR